MAVLGHDLTAEFPALPDVVLCDALPVHAPPVEGLVRGRPVQLLRTGPLYDPATGKHLMDVTDELCSAVAASASALGYAVPIDHGHALYRAQSAGRAHDSVALYGRISALEARPGNGLWGVPEWNAYGLDMLARSPGLLYLSPTLMGQPSNPRTGQPMPGRALHSVSLTPTPRQDGLDALALSRSSGGGQMADQTPRPAAVISDVVTLSQHDHAALLDRATGAERRVTELAAQLEEVKAQADAKEGEAVTLAHQVKALGEDFARLQTERKAEQFAALCAEVKRTGRNAGEWTLRLAATLPLDEAKALLMEQPVTMPTVPAGHGGQVEAPRDASDPAVIRAAVKIHNEQGVPYNAALQMARTGAQGVA